MSGCWTCFHKVGRPTRKSTCRNSCDNDGAFSYDSFVDRNQYSNGAFEGDSLSSVSRWSRSRSETFHETSTVSTAEPIYVNWSCKCKDDGGASVDFVRRADTLPVGDSRGGGAVMDLPCSQVGDGRQIVDLRHACDLPRNSEIEGDVRPVVSGLLELNGMYRQMTPKSMMKFLRKDSDAPVQQKSAELVHQNDDCSCRKNEKSKDEERCIPARSDDVDNYFVKNRGDKEDVNVCRTASKSSLKRQEPVKKHRMSERKLRKDSSASAAPEPASSGAGCSSTESRPTIVSLTLEELKRIVDGAITLTLDALFADGKFNIITSSVLTQLEVKLDARLQRLEDQLKKLSDLLESLRVRGCLTLR